VLTSKGGEGRDGEREGGKGKEGEGKGGRGGPYHFQKRSGAFGCSTFSSSTTTIHQSTI